MAPKKMPLENRPKGWMTTVLLVLLLLVVAAALYLYVRGMREGFAADGPATVTVFLMEGCPYCDQFKPEWDSFQKSVREQGLAIQTVTVDASDKVMTNKYGVNGFPSIFVEKKGKERTIYDGKRTAAELLAFVQKF